MVWKPSSEVAALLLTPRGEDGIFKLVVGCGEIVISLID